MHQFCCHSHFCSNLTVDCFKIFTHKFHYFTTVYLNSQYSQYFVSNMNLFYNLLATFSVVEIPFIVDILNHKYISNAVFFHCYEKQIVAGVHKRFNQYNIRITTANISTKYPLNISRYTHEKSAIIIDTACGGWKIVLDSESISFQNYSFVVMTEHLTSTVNTLARYPIQIDSDVTVAHKNEGKINLYEVFNTGFHYNGTFKVVNLGFWNSSLFVKERDRKNLHGLKIKIAAIILPTSELRNETVEQYLENARSKFDTVHRIKFFILLKYMRDMYNIR